MQKFSLQAMARELLERAREGSGRRAAATVIGGHEKVLRQTVIAMAGGAVLAEHENPGEASVHVLAGRVRLERRPALLGGPTWRPAGSARRAAQPPRAGRLGRPADGGQAPLTAGPLNQALDSHLGGARTLILPGRIGPATRESA